MNNQDIIATLKAAGFSGNALRTAWAILMRESGGNAEAYNPDRSTGDDSHGWFQINMLGSMGKDRDAWFRRDVEGYTGVESLKDPLVNARAAYVLSKKGTNWYHWDIDANGYDGGSHAPKFREQYARWPGDKGNGQVRSGIGGTGTAASPSGSTPPDGQDTLTVDDLATQNGFTMEFVQSHPAILKVFRQAIAEDWMHAGDVGKAKFENALHATPWWKNNSSYARDYLIAEMRGGKDWEDQQAEARTQVENIAMNMGATLDDKSLAFFTRAYMMNGWKDRPQFLQRALAGELEDFTTDHIDYQRGGASAITTRLRQAAEQNGVTFSDGYYQGAAKSVLAGLRTEDDFAAEIRDHAASRFPVFGKRIKAGENAKDIASPYVNRMADVLELDPNRISLDDPTVLKALGGVDKDGNPSAMSLWDFEKSLRQDDRWQYTKQANDRVGEITASILSMFGYGG